MDANVKWSVLTAEVEKPEADAVKDMIVDMWIALRGFSFAKSCMEKYKQATKKSTKKSKSLRKLIKPSETFE